MHYLAYVWRVVINMAFIVITLWVFDRLRDRTDVLVVALSGIVYVAVRSLGMALARQTAALAQALDQELRRIQIHIGLLDLGEAHERAADIEKAILRDHIRVAIEGAGLGVVSLVCLFNVFRQL